MAMTQQQLKVFENRLTQIAAEKLADYDAKYPEPRRYMTQKEIYTEFVAKRYRVTELKEISGYRIKLEECCLFPANEEMKMRYAHHHKARQEYKTKIMAEKTRCMDIATFGDSQEALELIAKFSGTDTAIKGSK